MENYLGEIRAFAGNYAPEGWLMCDGSILNIGSYESLFTLIGTIYGGNGSTTFGIPDLRGRLIVNRGTLPGGSSYNIGVQYGVETVSLTEPNLPSHTHTFSVSTQNATTDNPNGNLLAAPIDVGKSNEVEIYLPSGLANTTANDLNNNTITNSEEFGQSHENRMPFLCVSYIIAYQGLYPDFN